MRHTPVLILSVARSVAAAAAVFSTQSIDDDDLVANSGVVFRLNKIIERWRRSAKISR